MSTIKYISSPLFVGSPVFSVEVVKETGKFFITRDPVSGKERKRAKEGRLFDTFDEAKAQGIARTEGAITRLERELAQTRKLLGRLQAQTEAIPRPSLE